MDKSLKKNLVSKIKEDLYGKDFILSGFRGLRVSDVEKLRNSLRNVNCSCNVVKNRLFAIALKELDIMDGVDDYLKNATVLSVLEGQNSFDSFKILVDFSKNSNEKFYIKGGFVDGRVVSFEDVVKISDLPSRIVLLGKLLSVIQNPLYRVLLSLKNTTQKLVYVLSSIKNINK